jgi:hypothetical protein
MWLLYYSSLLVNFERLHYDLRIIPTFIKVMDGISLTKTVSQISVVSIRLSKKFPSNIPN